MNRSATSILLLTFLLSCQQNESGRSTRSVSENDEEMNEAMAIARSSLQGFISVLARPSPSQKNFGIKARFEENGNVEHVWIDNPSFDGTQFKGTIGNDPEDISSIKYGDVVYIPMDRVSDWMYVDGESLKGGFTMRVLRQRMSPQERLSFDEQLPFRID